MDENYNNQTNQNQQDQNNGYNQNNQYNSQNYQYQQQYQQPVDYSAYQYQDYQGKTDDGQGTYGMAVASLVLGICSLVFCCCLYGVSGILAILGLIFGIIALNRCSKSPTQRGKGMALAGVILCACGILLAIAVIVSIVFASADPSIWHYNINNFSL